jgi:hypothetical protein
MKKLNIPLAENGNYAWKNNGSKIRKMCDIDAKDKLRESYNIIFPKECTCITRSFLLGLFEDSIDSLGFNETFEKYNIEFETDNKELREILINSLSDSINKIKKLYYVYK